MIQSMKTFSLLRFDEGTPCGGTLVLFPIFGHAGMSVLSHIRGEGCGIDLIPFPRVGSGG